MGEVEVDQAATDTSGPGVDASRRADSLMARMTTGRFAAFTIAPIVVGIVAVILAARSGGSLADPVGHRVYEITMWVIAGSLVGVGIYQSVRAGRLSRLLVMCAAAGSMFWQETYGDWGSYVQYSSQFATYDWQGGRLTGPVNCWWFIPGYVVFYVELFGALILAVKFVRYRWPHRNPYTLGVLLSFPIFYVFDLCFEGTTVGLGYWNYEYAFGPAMSIGQGSFPLIWPIVQQVPMLALVAVALTWTNGRGDDVFEATARTILRRPPGQFAVLLSWVVLLNAAFMVTTISVQMAAHLFVGPAHALFPFPS